MRRQFGSVMLAGVIGLLASPAYADRNKDSETVAPATVAVQRLNFPAVGLRDEAAMVLVGTVLIALAAAVRKAA
jgi:hypothetical protein